MAHSARRWETTGSHHEYKPGPVAKAFRSLFVAVAPSSVKKRIAGRLFRGLSDVQRLEKEAQWVRLHGSPLRVLGLPDHAELAEVKARYKDLLFETHPDTAVAAARRAGVEDPGEYTAGTGGGSAAALVHAGDGLTDAQIHALAVERFELLKDAYKMATNPVSLWHQSGAAPQLYEQLRPPTLLSRVANPTFAFGFVSYALAACVMATVFYKVIPDMWERVLAITFPKFYDFMRRQEAEEARLRAQGIEPDTNPQRLAPKETKMFIAPGSQLLDPSAAEETDPQWKPKAAQGK
jgi:hypothetical protein